MSWDDDKTDDEWNSDDTDSDQSTTDWGEDDEEWDDPTGDDGSLDIVETLTDGITAAASISGVQLGGMLAVLVFLNQLVFNSLYAEGLQWFIDTYRDQITDPEVIRSFEQILAQLPLTVDLPLIAYPVLFLAVAILLEAAKIIAVRVFAAGELDGIPGALAQRRLGTATLFGVVGGFLISIALTIGFVMLIVPGIIVFLATLFFRQEIAVRDKGIVEAVKGSYGLIEGNWISLFILVVLVAILLGVVGGVIGFMGGIASAILPGTAGVVVQQGITALVSGASQAVSIAIVTTAWSRLVAAESRSA